MSFGQPGLPRAPMTDRLVAEEASVHFRLALQERGIYLGSLGCFFFCCCLTLKLVFHSQFWRFLLFGNVEQKVSWAFFFAMFSAGLDFFLCYVNDNRNARTCRPREFVYESTCFVSRECLLLSSRYSKRFDLEENETERGCRLSGNKLRLSGTYE